MQVLVFPIFLNDNRPKLFSLVIIPPALAIAFDYIVSLIKQYFSVAAKQLTVYLSSHFRSSLIIWPFHPYCKKFIALNYSCLH